MIASVEQDEASLLRAWTGGDKAAGERLFERYYPALTRFFVNKVRNTEEVEELVQRSFVTIMQAAPRYRGGSSVRTWVFGIARNLLRQFYDRRRREAGIEPGDEVSVADFDSPGASTLLRGKAEQKLLLTALRTLPLETQVILELFYWEEMRSREIGAVLGMPEGTVRSNLRSARQDLHMVITRLGEGPGVVESTVENLEGWAKGLHEVWGIECPVSR